MPSTLHAPSEQPQLSFEPLHHEGYRDLFKNKTFLALWVGQIFSQLADRIIFVVFITLIVTHFGAQGSLKSFLYIAFTIPAILLTAVAGVFVDRWSRRKTLVMTNLLRAVVVALIPVAVTSHSILGLYACAFFISAITQFFVPAESAAIPMVVSKPQLLVANSLFTTTMMGSVIFGFALGDPLIDMFGIREVHWSIVALFLLSSVALMLVRIPRVSTSQPTSSRIQVASAFHEFWLEMKEGIDYLYHQPAILHKILKLAVLFSTIVAMCILFISFAETYLYASPKIAAQKFAWIVVFSGLGMVTGSLLVGNLFRHTPRGKLVYAGFSLIGFGLLALLLTPWLSQRIIYPNLFPYLDFRVLYTHITAIFLGIGASLVAVPLQAVLHTLIPEDKRGKIMGVQFTLLSACSTFPVLIAGIGADVFGVFLMLVMMGFPLLIFGLKGLYDRAQAIGGSHAASW